MPPVVKQGIDRFLKHALFITDDDFRSLELKQVFEAVVSIDHPPIKIVQIGSGKAPTFQWHQRPEIWRNDWQHHKNHPIRTGLAGDEALKKLDALGQFFAYLLAAGLRHRNLQLLNLFIQVDRFESSSDSTRTHFCLKSVSPVGLPSLAIFHFAEQLMLLQRSRARVNDKVIFIINHTLELTRSHVEN